MLIRLSSEGRVVIPKRIRESLQLQKNQQFRVRVVDCKIILEPIQKDIVHHLHSKYAGHDLLNVLEDEHSQEVSIGKLR